MPIDLSKNFDNSVIESSYKYNLKRWNSQITGSDQKTRGIFNVRNKSIPLTEYVDKTDRIQDNTDILFNMVYDDLVKNSSVPQDKLKDFDKMLKIKNSKVSHTKMNYGIGFVSRAFNVYYYDKYKLSLELCERIAQYLDTKNLSNNGWFKLDIDDLDTVDVYIKPQISEVITVAKNTFDDNLATALALQSLDFLVTYKDPKGSYTNDLVTTFCPLAVNDKTTGKSYYPAYFANTCGRNDLSNVISVINSMDNNNRINERDVTDAIKNVYSKEIHSIDAFANTNAELSHIVKNLELISDIAKETIDQLIANSTSNSDNEDIVSGLRQFLVQFNEFIKPIELEIDAKVFTALNKILSETKKNIKAPTSDVLLDLSKLQMINLRILLANFLESLRDEKPKLHKIKPIDAVKQNVLASQEFSKAQKQLILADDNLVIGSAGAGSGKTHTLIGRLNYMQACGEDLNKTMVLSFTNVAAETIKNRYGNICSITLASLFDEIYHANFPNQKLANDATIYNSLRLLAHGNFLSSIKDKKQRDKIKEVAKDLRQAYGLLVNKNKVSHSHIIEQVLNIINNNFDEVVKICDLIGMTSLFLEPLILFAIICDANKPPLKVPQKYTDIENIITDESQDISTFEYILLIALTLVYKSSLCIIGDGSQTLYEFRNSNPQFLNALESSNIFTICKLSTNYRSNSEILSVANKFLSVIDANRYAKIQLQSNDLSQMTKDSFKQKVNVLNIDRINPKDDLSLSDILVNDSSFRKYILDNYDKGQIALLAYRRLDANQLANAAIKILNQNGIDLVDGRYINDVNTPVNVLSLMKSRNNQFNDYTKILVDLYRDNPKIYHDKNQAIALARKYYDDLDTEINDEINKLSKSKLKAAPKRIKALTNTTLKNLPSIWNNHLLSKLANLPMSGNDIFDTLYDESKSIENIINNQSLLVRNNAQDAMVAANINSAQLIVSTIHGAKGLEFEHAVIFYKETNTAKQDMLRLYGVALTRPKEDELIVNETDFKSFDSTITGMFKTPIRTAQSLVLDELKQTNLANNDNDDSDNNDND